MEAERTPAQVFDEFFVPALLAPCARELVEAVPPRRGERVLDVACGTGIVGRTAAPLVGRQGRVVGVDLLPGMIAVASSKPPPEGAPVEWREGDALELELPDASFDVAYCQQGIQFFADKEKALREMRRVLVDGGRVGIVVWQGLDRNEFFGEMCEIELRHLGDVDFGFEDVAAPFLFGDPEALRELVAAAGFRDTRVESRTLEARFPADSFARNVEFAYSVIVPEFAEDRSRFSAFVEAVERDMQDIVARHRVGAEIVFPMHANVATGAA